MIKVINLVALIIAPIVVTMVRPGEPLGAGVVALIIACALALVWAIWQSKREGPPLDADQPPAAE
jgi:K(+)-stimulated pyrophosphate-energized sodium pump